MLFLSDVYSISEKLMLVSCSNCREGMSYMSYQSKGTPSIDMSSEMTARSKIVEAQAKKSMKGKKKSKGLVFPDVG